MFDTVARVCLDGTMNLRNLPASALPCAVADLGIDLADFRAQRAYANGVTIYRRSTWGGNGFGTDVTRIAVDRDGRVVAVYDSGRTHLTAVVAGVGVITSDMYRDARGVMRVTTPAITLWTKAVKGMGVNV